MSLTGDTFDFQQGNVVTSSAQLVDNAATVGDVLTVQTDKSIAAAPGGGSLPSGADSPIGVVTPSGVGQLYIDTTHGTLYVAHGATSDDWTSLGGVAGSNGIGEVIGVIGRTGALYMLGGVDPDTPLTGVGPVLTDAYAQWNGNAAGLYVEGNGNDGEQKLRYVNAAGSSILHDTDGSLHPASGVVFPTSDPHVTNAWWDDNGTLVRSFG